MFAMTVIVSACRGRRFGGMGSIRGQLEQEQAHQEYASHANLLADRKRNYRASLSQKSSLTLAEPCFPNAAIFSNTLVSFSSSDNTRRTHSCADNYSMRRRCGWRDSSAHTWMQQWMANEKQRVRWRLKFSGWLQKLSGAGTRSEQAYGDVANTASSPNSVDVLGCRLRCVWALLSIRLEQLKLPVIDGPIFIR